MSAAGSRLSVRPRPAAGPRPAVRSPSPLVPLAGCAAGIQAETSRERPTIDGVGGAIGTLTIRNAYVGGPAENGGSAPVLLSVFNDGTEPDRLVSVSSPGGRRRHRPADTTLPPAASSCSTAPAGRRG